MRPAIVAAVQDTPVVLDREATLRHAGDLVAQAASLGANIVVFPEAFVPTYPDWVWRTTPWADGAWFERFFEQSVDLDSTQIDPVRDAARAARTYVCLGVNERDGGTIYNSLVYIDPQGDVAGVHRKLMPTGGERLVWGYGDGSGLVVLDTPYGRLGGLICWENYMPLARTAMYAKGVDILVAPTWDNTDTWVPSMRHIGKEGGCFVVGTTACMRGSDVPRDLPRADELYQGDDDWLSRGNSVVCGPEGEILAGPLVGERGIVTAEVDANHARLLRRRFDVVGHYARPDVFRLTVDGRVRRAAEFETTDLE